MAAEKRGSSRERGYTTKWDKASKAFRRENPICAHCEKRDIVTAAQCVDHIIPHKGDQTLFWDKANWQPLCNRCHSAKTVIEDGALGSGAQTHPEWLPSPACPVVVVTGPPGAGKTTYCKAHALPRDEVIDLDECFRAVCGVHGHEADRKHLHLALRLRNKLLADLASKHQGMAYLIVGSPTQAETQWWCGRLKAEHVLINPGIGTCLDRVTGTRRRDAVRQWFDRAKANVWHRPRHMKAEIDEEGWPLAMQ